MKTLLKVTFFVLLMAGCSRLQLGMDAGSGVEDKDCNDDWKVLEAFKQEADADDLQQSIDFLNSHTGDIEKLFEWNDDTYGFLHYAAAIGNLGLVKALLARGVPIDIRTGERRITPLLIAAREGNLEAVRELINQGANVYAQDAGDAGALHHAARSGQLDVFKEVAKKVGEYRPEKDKRGFTLLHLAVLSGSVELAKHILEQYGATMINESVNQRTTPLYLAAAMGNQPMVELILAYEKEQALKIIDTNHAKAAARIAAKKGYLKIAALIEPAR